MKILTYGTFDLFHYGHYKLLKRCKELCGKNNELIVGVSSDEMCLTKGKTTILKQDERMDIIKSLKFVDHVILEKNMAQKVFDAKKFNIDYFVLGNDYANIFPKMPEYNQLIQMGVKVVFLERTKDISTSLLKERL